MPVFQERPWTAWKFIRAPWRTTLFVPTDHSERSGPTILGKRHTNDPFCSDVRLGGLVGLLRGLVVVVVGLVVVVVGTVVVEVGDVVVELGRVVVVEVVVVVVAEEAGTNFTGR
jgi:hypothetical protein